MSDNVAIYGITGALGREVLAALEVDHEGIGGLVPVAGPRSAGQTVRWRGATLPIIGPGEVDPADVDVAIFATRADVVAREAPRIVHAGGRVIDASGLLARSAALGQTAPTTPIVWPQLTAPAPKEQVDLEVASAVALPSALGSTLAPILEAVARAIEVAGLPPLTSCDVVALMSASGAGHRGIDALSRQSAGLLSYQPIVDARPFPRVLAFNVLNEDPSSTLVAEERLQTEMAALVPAIKVSPSLVTMWVPALSGIVLTVTLRFGARDDRSAPSLLQTLSTALQTHPDLMIGEPPEDRDDEAPDLEDPEDDPEDDDDDVDAATISAALPAPANNPDVMALRDVLDQDEVRLAPPTLSLDGAVRLVAFADPLRRTAVAAQRIVARFLADLDADA